MASRVQVFIYDLSRGLARTLSFGLLGKQLDGIWHTGIVAYGKEFFFGGSGIESCDPGGTILGQPNSVVDLGPTEIPYELFYEHLQELSQTTFRPTSYHLLHRNCNNFSSEIAQFLTGRDIPPHITNLPDEVLSTPFGQLIKPMLDSMTINPGEGTHPVFGESNTPSHRVVTASTSSSGLNSTRPDFLNKSVTFTLNKSVTSDSVRPCQEDVKVIEELLNIIQRNDPSAVKPLHLETLDKSLTARISSGGESSPLWCIYQILFSDSWITQVSRHIGNMKVFSHFSTENIESLKALCNLCSTAAGYSVALNKAYGILKNLPSVVSDILASADLLDAAASTILNVSIQHKASDDLDVPYAATLSDFFTCREVIAPLIAEKFLIGIYNLMSKNDQTKELVYALGVSSERLTNVAASTQTCKEVIKLIDKMK